ncbi:hypothetical protein GH810_02640 [Acetobacterium paludosum]|uniref:Uncharacterized protein n=1 Tax=Acetobacterium paludosum TaxID=52693 RepID=A0A923HRT9_9FIRM|nr:hypothetical protein [Acetobacterium paludosum]MBC3887206.1 hypothetical protein [Acetobacterium paludosum]
MSRSIIDKENQEKSETTNKGLKLEIEKGLILAAFIIMLTVLFLVPEYEMVVANKEMLAEKNNISIGFPEKMTEKEYLSEFGNIREKIEEYKINIPDMIDSVGLYAGIVEMAEKAEVELISVKFNPIDTQMDEAVGLEMENEDKIIKGPDGRYLARCSFAIIYSGNEANSIRFLQEVENYQPILKTTDFEIKGEVLSEKTMTLKLESYGMIDEETYTKVNQGENKNNSNNLMQ